MVRCFLAINLSAETQDFLASSINKWHSRYGKQVRWVRPENCHLTLRFLGQVEEGLLNRIKKGAIETASLFSPFDIELGAPGVFPNPRFPRVLWLGLKGDVGVLGRLEKAIEGSLLSIGFEPEQKRFVPHITVGRIKGRRAVPMNIQGFLNTPVPAFVSRIGAVHLYRSILKPSGPVYRRLSTFPLRST